MVEIPAYERDPYQRELEVEVLQVDPSDEGCRAWLDDTLLYPEGGGQPSDRGWLDQVTIERVEKSARGIVHHLATSIEPGPARLRLDWSRRFDHMQQHTAQHLLTRAALDHFAWSTRSFHIGPRTSDIELDCPPPPLQEIEQLEDVVADLIRQAVPIRSFRVEPDEYERLAVRSRGLPAGHSGSIRLVEIAGFDLNTCGGTHVASTAEVEALKIVGSEPLRGGCRLSWVAGSRTRRRLADDEMRLAELRRLLDCGDDDLAPVVRLRLDQLRQQRQTLRRFEHDLADLQATALMNSDASVMHLHLEEDQATLVRAIAEAVAASTPDRPALLTAESDGEVLFALVIGEGCGLDLQQVGRELCAILGARGGGTRQVFQGKAESLAALPRALDYLRQLVGA